MPAQPMITLSLRPYIALSLAGLLALLPGCVHKSPDPEDPFEPVNRKFHALNMTFDRFILKPVAKAYKAILPPVMRQGINHFYDNIYMLPTVANDLLQGKWRAASDDAGRFVINSSIGFAGLFDPATQFNLPLHKNDLGLTFAHWGFKKSPYIVIPFVGPSTIRDGIGMGVEYFAFTPYPYIQDATVLNTLLAVRAVDLRSQFLENERLFEEALDKYSFLRDAYLQNRRYLIEGKAQEEEQGPSEVDPGSLYVDE